MNNRRRILTALGAGGLASFASMAQQHGKVWRVGWLLYTRREDVHDSHSYHAFPQGLRELGYVEGRNLILETRYADNKPERLAALAAELVQLKVDVLVSGNPPATGAAQQATATIPIVFLADLDPVASGLVASLARPGGNITGLSNMGVDLSPKLLQLLTELVPRLARVAVLVNPDDGVAQTAIVKSVEGAGQRIGVAVQSFNARNPKETEDAFAQMVRWKAGGVFVARGPFLNNQPRLLAGLVARHRLPAISSIKEHVEAGSLISYGASLADMYRRGAGYVDRILKGAKPADLPVEQPMIFEMLINRKTARSLGLAIPQSLLISADKVID